MHPHKTAPGALLLVAAALVSGCSAGSNRQLQSITITPNTASGAPVTYTATGTFNAAPDSVSPLPVSWFIMGPAVDPPGPGYSLVPKSYVAWRCSQANPATLTYTVIAVAPADPSAPDSGSMPTQVFEDLVIQHTKTSEGGFIAGTAKLDCFVAAAND